VDEWKLEQGLSPGELPLLDQTLRDETKLSSGAGDDAFEKSSASEKEAQVAFAEEYPGWRGYIEWEKYPEKRAKAAAILAKHKFPPPPEFQLGPIPDTNPVLEGVRWKLWHKAVGGPLRHVPEESWLRVIQEKHPGMLHLLQFPYNGEPPKVNMVRDGSV
jgi:sulfite oxidase